MRIHSPALTPPAAAAADQGRRDRLLTAASLIGKWRARPTDQVAQPAVAPRMNSVGRSDGACPTEAAAVIFGHRCRRGRRETSVQNCRGRNVSVIDRSLLVLPTIETLVAARA